MKLTQEQKDLVFSQISGFAGNKLGCDWDEMNDIAGNILDEVVADIEETADWSDLRAYEVHDGDVSIAIGRVVKKRLKEAKVISK